MPDDSGGYDDSGGPPFGVGNMGETGDQPSGGGFWDWLKGFGGGGGGGTGGGGSSTIGKAKTALDWAKFLADLVASRSKGSFQTAPMTPEEMAIMSWAMPRLMNAPDKSTGYPIGVYNAYAPKFDFAAARAGGQGYTPGSGLNAEQLAAILHPGSTSAATSPFSRPMDDAGNPISGRQGGSGLHSPLQGGPAK